MALTPHSLLAALEGRLSSVEVDRLLRQLRALPPDEQLEIFGKSRIWIQGKDNIVGDNNIVIRNLVAAREVNRILLPIENAATGFLHTLKKQYEVRHEQKLDGRSEIALEVARLDSGENTQAILGRLDRAPSGQAISVIVDTFDEEGRLLIIGNPGAGKTVLLLKLALRLLDKSETTSIEPIPVIFNLATWSLKYPTFEDWLTEMLVSANGLSRSFGRMLLRQGRISLLLDGLDELSRSEPIDLAAQTRATCLSSLNAYLDRGRKVAICCRHEEFLQIMERTSQQPPVSATVVVNDLTREQIIGALSKALSNESDTRADRVAARNILSNMGEKDSGALVDVLRTPFYFTAALEVFDRQIYSESRFPNQADELKRYLLRELVQRKVFGIGGVKPFDPERTLRWLKWLANSLADRNLVAFELADLQPSDLGRRWPYHALSGLIFVFVYGTGSCVTFIGLLMKIFPGRKVNRRYLFTLRNWEFWRNVIATTLVLSMIFGSSLGILFGAGAYFTNTSSTDPISAGLAGVFWGIFMGAILGATVGLGSNLLTSDIRTEDQVRWSLAALSYWRTWSAAIRFGLLIGVLFGGCFSFLALLPNALGLLSYAQSEHFIAVIIVTIVFVLALGVSTGLVGMCLGALSVLISSCKVVQLFVYLKQPYQRLRAGVVRSSLGFGILNAAVTPIIIYAIFFPTLSSDISSPVALLIIFVFLEVTAFAGGSLIGFVISPLFRHFVLRLFLILEAKMPWRYATFLDYASEIGVLEKDGGHWRFRHQYLQEYFASL